MQLKTANTMLTQQSSHIDGAYQRPQNVLIIYFGIGLNLDLFPLQVQPSSQNPVWSGIQVPLLENITLDWI